MMAGGLQEGEKLDEIVGTWCVDVAVERGEVAPGLPDDALRERLVI